MSVSRRKLEWKHASPFVTRSSHTDACSKNLLASLTRDFPLVQMRNSRENGPALSPSSVRAIPGKITGKFARAHSGQCAASSFVHDWISDGRGWKSCPGDLKRCARPTIRVCTPFRFRTVEGQMLPTMLFRLQTRPRTTQVRVFRARGLLLDPPRRLVRKVSIVITHSKRFNEPWFH